MSFRGKTTSGRNTKRGRGTDNQEVRHTGADESTEGRSGYRYPYRFMTSSDQRFPIRMPWARRVTYSRLRCSKSPKTKIVIAVAAIAKP